MNMSFSKHTIPIKDIPGTWCLVKLIAYTLGCLLEQALPALDIFVARCPICCSLYALPPPPRSVTAVDRNV